MPLRKMLQVAAVDFTFYHFLLPLVRGASDGFEVHIACKDGPYIDRIRDMGYKIHIIDFCRSLRPDLLYRATAQLYSLLRTERYDIVHVHTPVAGIIGRLVARLRHVPIIINTVHGFYFHEKMNPLFRYLAQSVEWLAGRVTTHSFFVSKEDYDLALKSGICRLENGTHIGNGVDQARFDPERPDLLAAASGLRREFGIDPDNVVICIVARMVREKGILDLLAAFRLLSGNQPPPHMLVVGTALPSDRDDAGPIAREMVERAGLNDRVHFLGARNDVEVVLKASDIFSLPSYREGMPRSIIEAMSMGLPVVATAIRGCREEVVDGVTGFLFPVGDVSALADKLTMLINDGALGKRMGTAGLARSRELYNEQSVIQAQLAVYSRLLEMAGI